MDRIAKIKERYQQIKKYIMKKGKAAFSQIGLFFEEWLLLMKVILSRFFMGFKSVNFIFYFLVIVLILGGLGVWVEVLNIPSDRKSVV